MNTRNNRRAFSLSLALGATLLLAGCAQYAEVTEKRPRFTPTPPGLGLLRGAEKRIGEALGRAHRQPLIALGEYLSVAETASRQLRREPADATAIRDYNFALGRAFAIVRDAKLDPWTHPLSVPRPDGGQFILTHKPDSRPQRNPALYEFTPADQFDIQGSYVTQRSIKAGLGAPLVVVGRDQRSGFRENFAMPRTYYGVTAIARFDAGPRCLISFEDPLEAETVQLSGHTFPLAADYSVPLAVMLAREDPKQLELARLLRPEKHAETARIARLQPYDPNKTVVLCVHGLMDSPATWAPMLNALRADPEIRRRFQFWFYSYPSGYPYPYSAAIMRRELDAVGRRFPLRKPMVLIGHSMGGIISRLMITDSGDKIWRTLFGKSPTQTKLSPHARELLSESLIFKHRPEVGRVIFIAAPHRGSELASISLGRIASMLVKTPTTLVSLGEEMRLVLTLDTTSLQLDRIPNSVDTLAPNNRFVKAINTIPITPGIPFHTICGDQGKGDAPNSSDGVVPYWSSHLDGALSEKVVPSSHSAHQNPQAIEEVRRILKLESGGSRQIQPPAR